MALFATLLVAGCGSSRVTSAARTEDPTRDAASTAQHDAASMAQHDAASMPRPPIPAMDAARANPVADAPNDAADARTIDACGHARPDVFADAVVSFTPGATAGFGAKNMPCVVLGPPDGGPSGGSLDVVSLGNGGSIVLEFQDVELVDGLGPDLLVFENAFPGWAEPGFVAVSEDGQTWNEWPCEPRNAADGYPHCAGVASVLSNPTNNIAPTDPAAAGGDAFDLADLGLTSAKFVRIRDGGSSHYSGISGGFDLDAIAAVHSTPALARHD